MPTRPSRRITLRRHGPYAVLALVAALAAAAYGLGLTSFVDADTILAHRETLRIAAEARPLSAAMAFMGTYIGAMSLALPCGGVLGLLAGLLFGRWVGTGLILVAGTVSAMLVFLVARGTLGAGLRARAGPLYLKLAGNMRANAFAYVVCMRVVPIFPFFVVNLIAALFQVRPRTFALATLIGKIPATFIYASLGDRIGNAESLDDLVTFESVAGLTALGLLALTPLVYRAWANRRGAVDMPS